MHRAPLAVLALLAVVLASAPAAATVVIPVAEADLIAQSAAVVVGRVTAIESHTDRGRIYTDVTVDVDEMLKGDSVPTLTVRVLGGRVGNHAAWVEGSPEFRRGERVLLFVSAYRDGTARVAHFYQGKFSIIRDTAGDDMAVRETPAGVHLPSGAAVPATAPRHLRHFRDAIRAHVSAAPAARGGALTSARAPATAGTEAADTFALLGLPSRWFEPDAGQPVRMLINGRGEPLAPGSGFAQIRDAMAAWSGVAGSSFRYEDAGTTTAGGFRNDGVSAIAFRDPLGDIDPPVNCTGTLAYGGYFRSDETRVVNGRSFYRIIEGDVVFADGWDGCGFYERYANLAEVATHELGHVLGLDHPTDTDATMYAYAHFDGRGASIHASDLAGLRYLYPAAAATLTVTRAGAGSGTVTSAPAGIGCGADCTESYAPGTVVTLTAAPAAGSTFGGWSGTGCGAASTCAITLSGATSVAATFNTSALAVSFAAPAPNATVSGTTTVTLNATGAGGYTYRLAVDGAIVYSGTAATYAWNTIGVANGTHTLTATVTDGLGRTASASRSVTVQNGSTTPTGSLQVSITQPKPGTTVKGTAWAVVWVNGAQAGSTVTLTLGGRTVGSTSSSSAGPISLPYNTALSGDGVQTLTASARDASGKAGASSVSVTVSNGGTASPAPTPAPLTAAFTTPAAGATVRGTTTVTMSAAGGRAPYTYTLALDGTPIVSSAAASYAWNTATASNATHTLTLTVRDVAGAGATATRTVTVANTVAPQPPPTTGTLKVFITQPANGGTVTGTVWPTLWVEGQSGTSNTFTISTNGQVVGSQVTSSRGPVSIPWITTGTANGVTSLTATVRDAAGNAGSTTISVTIRN
ncbi:MAG TPA: Ig-like domain-containing protein [Methylomirabilota bacterium]